MASTGLPPPTPPAAPGPPGDPLPSAVSRAAEGLASFLRRQPRWVILAASYLYVVLVAVIDSLTPPDLSFLIFYLPPVFVVTLFVGAQAGVLISVAGTAVWFLANDAELLRQSSLVIPYWNLLEKLGFFFLTTLILSVLRRSLSHEKEMARTDPLTGLANQRHFLEATERELVRSRRYRRPLTVACIDIDDFKGFNDRFGHAEGDRLLRAAAAVLAREVRDVDLPARLGEDKFVLLLPETGLDAARAVLRHVQARLAAGMEAGGRPVTTTLGAATFPAPPRSAEEALRAAVEFMYSGKSTGKNTMVHKTAGDREGAEGAASSASGPESRPTPPGPA